MGNINFSNKILARIRASAINHTCSTSNFKHSSNSTMNRIEAMIGYICDQDVMSNSDQLDIIISLLSSSILSEQKKAKNKPTSYNYSRHIEMHKLHFELKEKRSVL